MKMMTTVCVRPWRETEVLNDLVAMCQASATTDVAVMYLCHPEGLPLLQKSEEAAGQFRRIKAVLAPAGIRAGVLFQTLVDHGERFQPLSPAPFQRITGFDGTICHACFCPVDPGFLEYTREMVTLFCRAEPDFLLVDDDVRVDNHSPARWACACPMHVELFNREAQRHDTCEQIFAAMKRDDETGQATRRLWQHCQDESLLMLMHTIRSAIDRVDPTIRCGKCVSGGRHMLRSEPLVRALAGRTVPFLRLAGAYYGGSGYEQFAKTIANLSAQKNLLSAGDIELLCEADTFLHTRYHTPTRTLRGFIAGSILAADIDTPYTWIPGTAEWIAADVAAYSRALKTSLAFFEECKKVSQAVQWFGPTIVTNGNWRISQPWAESAPEGDTAGRWGGTVCGRLGLPFTVNDPVAPVYMLDSTQAAYNLSDAELQAVFAKGVLLDGAAALALSKLGYAELMGVEVTDGDNDLRYYFEKLSADTELNGSATGQYLYAMRSQIRGMTRLAPLSSKVRVASSLMTAPWADSKDQREVSPAVTAFENKLGGRVVVCAHELDAGMVAWVGFLGDIRKEQLIALLGWVGRQALPAVAHTGVNTYLLYGYDPNAQEHVAAVFNLNPDDIEPLLMQFDFGQPSQVRRLTDDGQWTSVPFQSDGALTQLEVCVRTLQPLVLRIKKDQLI